MASKRDLTTKAARPSAGPRSSSRPRQRDDSRRPRVGLVLKKSMWQAYIDEKQDAHLHELVARGDATVAQLKAAHDDHQRAIERVHAALDLIGAEVPITIEGAARPFDASDLDLVVTVGGDGTLLRASHQLRDTPILGINSAPKHSVGFFCGAVADDAPDVLRKALNGSLKRVSLTRMKVTVNGTVVAGRVLNDALFCHASPAATSRYLIRVDDRKEDHRSSGFWIGPAAGSTAAQCSAGGEVMPLTSTKLQLVVREAYTPHGEPYGLRHAFIKKGHPVVVRSKMRDGRVYFDGHNHAIPILFGDRIEFTQADDELVLLGISARRKWGKRED